MSSRPLAAAPPGGEVSMRSWPGRGPGLESQLSWEVSWLDMEEPEGRMGALLKSAGEKSLKGATQRGTFTVRSKTPTPRGHRSAARPRPYPVSS